MLFFSCSFDKLTEEKSKARWQNTKKKDLIKICQSELFALRGKKELLPP